MKMKRSTKGSGLPLTQKLTLGNVILVLLTLSITMIIALRFNIELQERRVQETLRDVGEMLAGSPLVSESLRTRKPN